jgi:filamentous hemagglutinin
MSTYDKDRASQAGEKLDVKAVYPGHEGKSYHGFLLGGKYATLRDAGNMLAGINAKAHGQDFAEYMKGAGAYQQAGTIGVIMNTLFGITYGTAPYFGESNYTGDRVRFGYE